MAALAGVPLNRMRTAVENTSSADLTTTSDQHDGLDSSFGSPSRTNTMTSGQSFHAPPSVEGPHGQISRSLPHQAFVGIPISALERPGTGTRAFFAKGGRVLRKHASKLSLSTGSLVDRGASGDLRHRSTTLHDISQGRTFRTAPLNDREAKKRAISEPYEFRHVTHTDRAYLDSLNRVPKSELVSEFTALRAGQRPKTELRGIRVDDLPPTKPLPDTFQDLSPTHTTPQQPLPDPPEAAPPALPLKDVVAPASDYKHVRQSRSIENYSRPVSSSASANRVLPTRLSSRNAFVSPVARLEPFSPLAATREDTTDVGNGPATATTEPVGSEEYGGKPLPSIPFIVHAVSTRDDSARQLHTTPLPRPPLGLEDVAEEEISHEQAGGYTHVQEAPGRSKSLRHAQSFPSSARGLQPAPRAVVQQDANKADHLMATNELAVKPSLVSLNTSSLHEWEDAIDDSWDAVEMDTMALEPEQSTAERPATGPIRTSVSKTPDSNSMSVKSLQPSPLFNSRTRPSPPPPEQEAPRRTSPPLLGLGINSVVPFPSERHASFPEFLPPDQSRHTSLEACEQQLAASFTSDQTTSSVVTKSSSQESIIFSIASSIMGTQRSSNSSTSLAELTTATTSVDHSPKVASCDDWREPLATLEEDAHCPSPLSVKMAHKHKRAQSLAHNFVVRDWSPSAPLPLAAFHGTPPRSPRHSGRSSTSRIPIPARSSSISTEAARPTPGTRQRSATTVSKHRPVSRASYSLFPATTPPPPASTPTPR